MSAALGPFLGLPSFATSQTNAVSYSVWLQKHRISTMRHIFWRRCSVHGRKGVKVSAYQTTEACYQLASMFAAIDHTDAVIDAHMLLYRYDTQISTYHVSDFQAERANSKIKIPESFHNEPQARQYRMIMPLVNDFLRAHVFCFQS